MIISQEEFNNTLKDTRFIILDKENNILVSQEFEMGEDFYIEEYKEDIQNLVKECIEYFTNRYENIDSETLEIFTNIEDDEDDIKLQFIDIVAKYDSLCLVSWIGIIEHCDMVYDVWYDKNNNKFYTEELEGMDIVIDEIDDIDKYELQLNS